MRTPPAPRKNSKSKKEREAQNQGESGPSVNVQHMRSVGMWKRSAEKAKKTVAARNQKKLRIFEEDEDTVEQPLQVD